MEKIERIKGCQRGPEKKGVHLFESRDGGTFLQDLEYGRVDDGRGTGEGSGVPV